MPYSDLEIAEQFADEIREVEFLMAGAPADEAFLVGQVYEYLRMTLVCLVEQIDPLELRSSPWWHSWRAGQ